MAAVPNPDESIPTVLVTQILDRLDALEKKHMRNVSERIDVMEKGNDLSLERMDAVEQNAGRYMQRVHSLEDTMHETQRAVQRLDAHVSRVGPAPQPELDIADFVENGSGPAARLAEPLFRYTEKLDLPPPAAANIDASLARLDLLQKGVDTNMVAWSATTLVATNPWTCVAPQEPLHLLRHERSQT